MSELEKLKECEKDKECDMCFFNIAEYFWRSAGMYICKECKEDCFGNKRATG